MTRDEVARQVAKRFGLSNPDLWIAGHNRWETKLWDALIDSELRIQELREALGKIAALDAKDSKQGWNEWGEADFFRKAKRMAAEGIAV